MSDVNYELMKKLGDELRSLAPFCESDPIKMARFCEIIQLQIDNKKRLKAEQAAK